MAALYSNADTARLAGSSVCTRAAVKLPKP